MINRNQHSGFLLCSDISADSPFPYFNWTSSGHRAWVSCFLLKFLNNSFYYSHKKPDSSGCVLLKKMKSFLKSPVDFNPQFFLVQQRINIWIICAWKFCNLLISYFVCHPLVFSAWKTSCTNDDCTKLDGVFVLTNYYSIN